MTQMPGRNVRSGSFIARVSEKALPNPISFPRSFWSRPRGCALAMVLKEAGRGRQLVRGEPENLTRKRVKVDGTRVSDRGLTFHDRRGPRFSGGLAPLYQGQVRAKNVGSTRSCAVYFDRGLIRGFSRVGGGALWRCLEGWQKRPQKGPLKRNMDGAVDKP